MTGLTWGMTRQEKGRALNCRRDKDIYEELIRHLDRRIEPPAESPGQLILNISRFFLGIPYETGTLEGKGVEYLVFNLRKFDCFTFVENAVALARHIGSGKRSFPAFLGLLRKIRYRQGRLQGYPSRLHYFSDWIRDNQKKGILRDITAEIGGRPLRKPMTFMTAHADLYPPLEIASNFRAMKAVERTISRRSLYFVRKRELRHYENRIHDGDLIAITTDREGLDVQHVGLAVRVKNRVHLLHASSREGRVSLSGKTLYRYLMENRARSGIMVARLIPSPGFGGR